MISQPIKGNKIKHGAGFEAYGVRHHQFAGMIDPVIMIDDFYMREPTFAPHPHAGFSAVTYMLEDAEGGFRNRDSLGTVNDILPGDLHWTLAGRGVVHDEVPIVNGSLSRGLQIFVNLAAEQKFLPPQGLHVSASEMPVVSHEGVRTRVVAGSYAERASPLKLPHPFTLLDVSLDIGASFSFSVPAGYNALFYGLKGAMALGADGATDDVRTFTAHEGVAVSAKAESISVSVTAKEPAQFVVLSGKALNEPIVAHGPFVMNTPDQIRDVEAAYRRGDMGFLQ
jgi:redox-sensitive bicupin YhaK (pirin superfamily)